MFRAVVIFRRSAPGRVQRLFFVCYSGRSEHSTRLGEGSNVCCGVDQLLNDAVSSGWGMVAGCAQGFLDRVAGLSGRFVWWLMRNGDQFGTARHTGIALLSPSKPLHLVLVFSWFCSRFFLSHICFLRCPCVIGACVLSTE